MMAAPGAVEDQQLKDLHIRLRGPAMGRVDAGSSEAAAVTADSLSPAANKKDWKGDMAGHSKWANIKHRKAAQDKKTRQALYQTDS